VVIITRGLNEIDPNI